MEQDLSTGLQLYTEDTTLDVQKALGLITDNEFDLKSNPISKEFVTKVLEILSKIMVKEAIEYSELWSLSMALKRMSKKLELTTGESTILTLRHTSALFLTAQMVINRSDSVFLIESCDSKFHQIVSDCDIVYSAGDLIIQADVCHSRKNDSHEFYVWQEREQRDKYAKLGMMAIDGCVQKVIDHSLPADWYNLQSVIIHPYDMSPREMDFLWTDRTIDAFHGMSWNQAEGLLKEFADGFRDFGEDRSMMVQTPGFYTHRDHYGNLVNLVSVNNKESAKAHMKLIAAMKKSLLTNKNYKDGIDTHFSLSHYDRITSCDSRWHEPCALLERGCTENDPFRRLKLVLTELEKSHLPTDSISYLISKLDDNDMVDGATLSYDNRQLSELARMLILHRCHAKDGEKMDAFRMTLRPGVGVVNQIVDLFNIWRDQYNTEHEVLDHSELESEWAIYKEQSLSDSQGSYLIDDVLDSIDDVMPGTATGAFIRKTMRSSFEKMAKTKIMSRISMQTELTQSILTGARKRKALKRDCGSVKSRSVVMGLTNISDRKGVVMHNLGPLTFGEFKDVTYAVMGKFSPGTVWTKRHHNSISTPLTMSPSMLDWHTSSFHKAVSWSTLYFENCIVNYPREVDSIRKDMIMPLSLTFLNSNKFSQVADQLRYFFVNGVGYTSGVAALYKKIEWYTPKTNLEKLYLLRLMKMSDTLSAAKALNLTDSLSVKRNVRLTEQHSLDMTLALEGWKIAMPDESHSYLSQQHTFNSFYNSRALSMTGSNKLTGEALVVKKQLEAKDDYRVVKSAEFKHEGRFCCPDHKLNVEEFIDMMRDHDHQSCSSMPFSPCPRVIYLAGLSTLILMRNEQDKTVLDTVKRSYNLKEVHRNMKVSDVMNNRGSLKDTLTNGICVCRKPTKTTTGVKQNSKCYKTIISLLCRYVNGEKPSVCPGGFEHVADKLPMEFDPSVLPKLSELPDQLAGVLCWLLSEFAVCVSRMERKIQVGQRELAILNANARIICRYIEDCSRHIRDVELRRGLTTNLIEVSDKRDIVLRSKRRNSVAARLQHVLFDSADCSTWGPSMMCHAFYQTLMTRHSGDNKVLLRNSLALFGNKVYKIPDNIFWELGKNHSGVVGEVLNRLENLKREDGDMSKQILFLEESMHQGILGCTSSVLGGDAHNLSNYVLKRVFSSYNLNVQTFSTSDDYARTMSWDKNKGLGRYGMSKSSLSIHTQLLKSMGIKRNLQKSTLSNTYFEFNSEFFTESGEFRPDVKSRISFVDTSPDTDPYPIALRPMNQAVEYLRVEGSLVGATWVFLCNNLLAMYQNQSRVLWKELGDGIYKVPLELGGLISPNVIACSTSHKMAGLINNYDASGDVSRAMSIMMDCTPFSNVVNLTELREESGLKMPSMSRSGMVHLCGHTSRSSRDIREFLNEIPDESFLDVFHSRYASTIITALIACAHREDSKQSLEGSSRRFMVTQTPRDAKIYKINSRYLSRLFDDAERVSRLDLHEAAKRHLLSAVEVSDLPLPLDVSVIEQDIRVMNETLESLCPEKITPVPRIGHYHVRRQSFSMQNLVSDCLREFEEVNLPKSFGGCCDIKPWVFLESKMCYSQFLNNVSCRKQVFRLVLRERDVLSRNFVEILLTSNFVSGARMSYSFDGVVTPRTPIDNRLNGILDVLDSRGGYNNEGSIIDITSPGAKQLFEAGRVKCFDLTELHNMLIGDSKYMFRSQGLQQTLLSKLHDFSNTHDLKIDPMRLSVGFDESKFKSSAGCFMWQRNINGQHGLSGREVIMSSKGYYDHYLWGTKFDVDKLDDGEKDSYHLSNISQADWLSVKLTTKQGFLVSSDVTGTRILQVLSQTTLKKSTINLYCKESMISYRDFISRLAQLTTTDYVDKSFVEFFQASGLESVDAEVSNVVISDSDSEDLSSVDESDFDLDSDSDDIDDDELDAFQARAEEAVRQLEESDMLDEEGFPLDTADKVSEPVSSQSSIRQPVGVLVSMYQGSVRMLDERNVNRCRRKTGQPVKFGYTITFPVPLGFSNLVDDEHFSAIDKLYNFIDQLDAVDKLWLEEWLNQTFLNYAPVSEAVSAYKDMLCSSSSSNSADDDDDDDFEWN